MHSAQAPFRGPAVLPAAKALLKGAPRGQGRHGRLHRPLVRASADIGMLVAALADEGVKPGSVDAPIGVIIGAAIVVTAVLTFVIPAVLNPGSDAAEKIFERDAKSGRRR